MENATQTDAIMKADSTSSCQLYYTVLNGLSSEPKFLDSKYFYDATGDKLFQDIMDCGDYYPTKSEMEIFITQTAAIAKVITATDRDFDLIELGAGDATKSTYLLKFLLSQHVSFTYLPIDISENIIDYLNLTLPVSLPGLKMKPLNGDYFEMLKTASAESSKRKIVLFLGANIGNMDMAKAEIFCRELRSHLNPGDAVLIGIDLKKNPKTILTAYNDTEGLTKKFNLNLLVRINRELGADFDLDQFDHYPTDNPETGACKSYLISLKDQDITFKGHVIHFKKDEYIDMEISQKYGIEDIERLARQSGFQFVKNFSDHKNWFVDTAWMAV